MSSEKRKDHRKAVKYPARIDLGDGTPHLPCVLSDVSASGARVTVEGGRNLSEIPDRFTLLLAGAHAGTRPSCNVVWRTETQLGLEFEKAPPIKPFKSRSFRDSLRAG